MSRAIFLPVHEGNFLSDNAELLPALLGDRATRRHILAFCTNFRLAAIASLLMTGRARQFRDRLQRSGAAYAYYLARVPEERQRVSDAAPLLDALAAADYDSARTIARWSSHRWTEAAEYEEDFLFCEFIMVHALSNEFGPDASQLLERWQSCLAGTDDRRLDVCRAIASADAAQFADALALYLDERGQYYEEHGDVLADEVRLTEPVVSIEALAFIRLAERRGIPVEPGYRQVPEPARRDEPVAWAADSFTRLD